MPTPSRIGKVLFALAFVLAGVSHFTETAFFLAMMPDILPWHLELVYLSGVIEIVLGALLLVPRTSRAAAWGLAALLVAVFPANINMAVHAERWPEIGQTALLVRLPIQAVLVYIAWRYTRSAQPADGRPDG